MVEKRIPSSTFRTFASLQDAASVAGLLVTTEATIAEMLKKELAPPMPAGAGIDF